MKNRKNIRLALGMNQQEMADMLNVHRSQISMYESGQRQLPLYALKMLGELEGHVKQSKKDQSREAKAAMATLRKSQLQYLLSETILKHHALEKELEQLLKKQAATASRVLLKDFQFKDFKPDWPLVFPKKPNPKLQEKADAKLVRMEIQLELLAQERAFLEMKLKED